MSITVEGIVTDGNKLGRRIGFPTANIRVGEELETANGVYAARVELDGRSYGAVANLGTKPTVSGNAPRMLEAHIFDFDGNLYGRSIRVTLGEFIRPEERFRSMDELRTRIEEDSQKAKEILKTKI